MLLFINLKRILVNLLQQYMSDRLLALKQYMKTLRRCSSHITPQSNMNMHSGTLSVNTLSQKHIGMKSYTTSTEYEPKKFEVDGPKVSTILYCLV